MPKISCIVPVYNTEAFLPKCIDSILAQTFTDFELILVDDGSPDNCPKICDIYAKKDPRIIVIHKENKGAASARNAGIDKAQGEYITFVDSDDWIDSNMYEEMIKTTDFLTCDLIMCGIKKQKQDKTYELLQFNKSDINFFYPEKKDILLLFRNLREKSENAVELHAPVNKLFKKNLLNEPNNEIRYNENMLICEDGLFCIQFFDKTNTACVLNNSFYNYTYNENSICHEYNTKKKHEKKVLDGRELKLQTFRFYLKNNLPINGFLRYFNFGDIYGDILLYTYRDELNIFSKSIIKPMFLIKNFPNHKKDVLKIVLHKMKLLNLFRKLKIIKN